MRTDPHSPATKRARPALTATRVAALALALAAVVLGGCGTTGGAASVVPDAPRPYRLSAGDTVQITVHGVEGFSESVRLDADGIARLRYLEEVTAQGLTVPELTDRLRVGLRQSELFQSPEVTVQITAYRPIYVLGQVNAPGSYPYVDGMTVLAGIAVAGGLTPFANDHYTIRRTLAPGRVVDGGATNDTLLYPGDVVTISEPRAYATN